MDATSVEYIAIHSFIHLALLSCPHLSDVHQLQERPQVNQGLFREKPCCMSDLYGYYDHQMHRQ